MPAALVTGSSRGIGRAIAERYAQDGYHVAINYHSSQDAAEEAADRIESSGGTAITIQADVSDPDEATRLVDTAAKTFGGLDHVVNNAGINQHKYTDELTSEEFGRMLQVNLTSVFTVTKAAIPYLLESTVEELPTVTNLSSTFGFTGAPHEPHYAASKGGVTALTRSHAREFAPDIRVNALSPGFIRTDMTDYLEDEGTAQEKLDMMLLDEFGRPEDIAQAAAYLRDADFVTGETIQVNGGEILR